MEVNFCPVGETTFLTTRPSRHGSVNSLFQVVLHVPSCVRRYRLSFALVGNPSNFEPWTFDINVLLTCVKALQAYSPQRSDVAGGGVLRLFLSNLALTDDGGIYFMFGSATVAVSERGALSLPPPLSISLSLSLSLSTALSLEVHRKQRSGAP